MSRDLFGKDDDAPQVAHVYRIGPKVVTFDQHDRVMREYTGMWTDLEERIRAAMTQDTIMHGDRRL